MKKIYKQKILTLVFLMLLSGFISNLVAQVRYIDVNPGLGTLNNAILGDTASDGSRIDPNNTIYRLKRVEDVYYISALIENLDWPLTVVAEDGDGPKPFIALLTDENGVTPENCFRPKGDLTLKGLHLTNKDNLDGLQSRIIRASADNIKITIDDCWLDDAGQSVIRLDNEFNSIFITNSVFSNIGQPADPDNGRGIDDRGNSIDTIIIEDCSFYNISQRFLRDGGGHIKYCKINNCNFINIGQRGFGFGVIAGLDFTNNILYNMQFVPRDTATTEAVFEIDSISQELLELGFEQKINITNNSVYLDSSIFKQWLSDSTQVLFADPIAQLFIDENTDAVWYWNEKIPFTSIPGSDLALLTSYQMDPNLDLSLAPDWSNPEPPNTVYHLDVPYDFSYISTLAAKGATHGGQLGDRNWKGQVEVSVFDNKNELVDNITIYPNPANNYFNIKFRSSSNESIAIELFNILGDRIDIIEHDDFVKGEYSINYDSSNLKPGIYFVQLKSNNKTSSVKLLIN